MRIGIISLGAMLAMTAGAFARTDLIAQNDSNPSTKEIQGVLNAAEVSDQTETAQIIKDQTANGAALDRAAQIAERALANGPDTALQQKVAADGQKLEDTMKTLSPEAQKLLTQSNAAPLMRAPDPDAATAKGAPAVPTAPAAQAKPKVVIGADGKAAGKDGDAPAKPDNDIHITCEGVAYFDSRDFIGVFTDQVEVIHPGFHLFCEQLEIYMIKDSEKKPQPAVAGAPAPGQPVPANKPPAPAPSPAANPPGSIVTSRAADPDATVATAKPVTPGTAPAADATKKAEPQPDSNIRQAIARGPKVVVIKKTETNEDQIGVCRNFTYIGENGDVILRDMPLVQRGNHVHYAIDPVTYMVIHQNGKLDTFGPAKTDIIQEKEPPPGTAPAVATAPVPPAPPAKAGPPAKKAQ